MKRCADILFFCLLCFLCACDVIGESDRLLPVDGVGGEASVLLVEFTGVGCVNCPSAAAEAKRLHEYYGDRLVVVEMHPPANPFTKAVPEYDYTCAAADKYYALYGGTPSSPLPAGVVNGRRYDGTYFADWHLWGTAVADAASRKVTASLDVAVERQQQDFSIDVSIASVPDGAMLIVWLTEDSLVGAQLMPDGSADMNYVHNHVLRTEVYAGAVATQQTFYCTLSDAWKAEHCAVVAVLTDSEGAVLAVKRTEAAAPKDDRPLQVIVDGVGTLPSDTTVVIGEYTVNPLTGKPLMEITGSVFCQGVLTVVVERDDALYEDQFCCADMCVNTDYESVQRIQFSVKDMSRWFAHFTPEEPGTATITYIFAPDNINSRRLTVEYRYQP